MALYTLLRNGMSNATEEDFSNLAVAFLNSGGGVVGASDYMVSQQATPNNSVLVNTGRAYVPNSTGTMTYATLMDATQSVTIAGNSSGNPRIDAIVLYINLSVSPDANADNVAQLYDVQGAPGSSPTAPTNSQILTAIGSGNPYIVLANVNVANGFTSITSANITDERTFAGLVAAPTFLANGNSGTAATVNWSSATTQSFTLTGNCTFTFSNPVLGDKLVLILTQDSTGSRTVTWPGSVLWSNDSAPSLTTTAGAVDMVGFIYNGTNYLGFSSLNY